MEICDDEVTLDVRQSTFRGLAHFRKLIALRYGELHTSAEGFKYAIWIFSII